MVFGVVGRNWWGAALGLAVFLGAALSYAGARRRSRT